MPKPDDSSSEKVSKPERSRLRRVLVRILVNAAIIYVVIILAAFVFQKYLIYHPEKIDTARKIHLSPNDKEVWINVPEVGKIYGIFRPAIADSLTVLYLHGNAGNILDFRDVFNGLASLGPGVIAIDYPGFGKSEGSPSEEALYASSHATVKFLEESGVRRENMVIFGRSLGTAVAVELAASGGFAGVILESPFTNLAAPGQRRYWFVPVSLILRESYDSMSRINRIGCPLLVIVGTEDAFVTPRQSAELFREALEPKKYFKVKGAGHNDIIDVGAQDYWNTIRDWLKEIR